eukprot:3723598-Prymnesium_polylepis.1
MWSELLFEQLARLLMLAHTQPRSCRCLQRPQRWTTGDEHAARKSRRRWTPPGSRSIRAHGGSAAYTM